MRQMLQAHLCILLWSAVITPLIVLLPVLLLAIMSPHDALPVDPTLSITLTLGAYIPGAVYVSNPGLTPTVIAPLP